MTNKNIQFSIYLPIETNERLEQLVSEVRPRISKNAQVVFILEEALKNYNAFLECVKEPQIMGHSVKLDENLDEGEWHVQSEANV